MSDLDRDVIARELEALGATVGRPLSVVGLTGSTNDDARAAASAGAPHGSAFLADAQAHGRGRRGHTWHSPAGENLYLSVLLRTHLDPASVSAATLAIGVAVARVIEELAAGRAGVWVKWPNDVLAGADRKKLAGVLVEGQIRGAEVTSVVAGVGVNVHAAAFPQELASRATSLAMLGIEPLDRSTLAARLLTAIGAAMASYERDRLVGFAADLERLDGLRGRDVEVSGVEGRAVGIDAAGRLLVQGVAGVVTVVAGEVSVSSRP